jgi:hypothetical protein
MTAAASVASPAPPQVLLAHHLRQLKLPTFLREYEKVASEAAREGNKGNQRGDNCCVHAARSNMTCGYLKTLTTGLCRGERRPW